MYFASNSFIHSCKVTYLNHQITTIYLTSFFFFFFFFFFPFLITFSSCVFVSLLRYILSYPSHVEEDFVYNLLLGMDILVETGTLSSDIYIRLGLRESKKKTPENPRVLSLLSSVLERSVLKNEMLLESQQIKDPITIFHGTRAPALGIRQYIDRIFKYSCCSPSCFIVAQIYVNKFIQCNNVQLTSLSVHRLLITGVMVAAKFMDDAFFNNAYYARVGGVSTTEMNRLEMKFLFGLDFRLQVSIQKFDMYCLQLEKEGSGVIQIERLIKSCGNKESWSNNEDSTYSPTIAR